MLQAAVGLQTIDVHLGDGGWGWGIGRLGSAALEVSDRLTVTGHVKAFWQCPWALPIPTGGGEGKSEAAGGLWLSPGLVLVIQDRHIHISN